MSKVGASLLARRIPVSRRILL